MKPLLTTILLIICSLTWGQDSTYTATDGRTYKLDGKISFWYDYDTETGNPPIVTLDMLLDYSEECYNDSTAYFKHKYEVHDWDTNVDQYWIEYSDDPPDPDVFYANRKYLGKVTLWKHKQPTFKGFIEYLKNKYLED